MSTLSVISDYPLSQEYIDVLDTLVTQHDEFDYDELQIFTTDYPVPPRRYFLVIGRLHNADYLPAAQPVVFAPSVKELTATADGASRLLDSLRMLTMIRNKVKAGPYEEFSWGGEARIMAAKDQLIAVDIEVSGDVSKDEPEDTELLSVSVSMRYDDELLTLVFNRKQLRDRNIALFLAILLSSNDLIMHNGKFDARWLNRLIMGPLGFEPIYPTHDTMLMHHSLNHGAKFHGLKELAHTKLGAEDWEKGIEKYLGKSKTHYERIPQDVLVKYNAGDTYFTYLLFELLSAQLASDPDASRVYQFEMQMSWFFQDVEQHGVWVDEQYLRDTEDNLTVIRDEVIEQLRDGLRAKGIEADRFNPNSPDQVKEKMGQAFGVWVGSTNEKMVLKLMMDYREPKPDLVEWLTLLLRFRAVNKQLTTYVRPILAKARNGYVHPSFLVHGTSTGRTSCKGPNVQNLTNETEDLPSVRRALGAPPGRALVGVDYGQAELRVMAEMSDDPDMIKDLQADAPDFFDNMLPKVFPDVDFTVLDAKHRKPYRLKLKRVVYGSSYGLQPATVANTLTLEGSPTTPEEAQAIQDGYLGVYPGLRNWRDTTMTVLKEQGLITPFGRRFQQDVITTDKWGRIQNQAWAFRPQSTASDICITAAIMLQGYFKDQEWDAHIVATVHDAIYVECDPDIAEAVLDATQSFMELAATGTYTRVPFITDGKIGRFMSDV